MFEHLKRHSKILVTGSQRSGTTIAARIIAFDTGYRFIDESDFHTRDIVTFESFVNSKENLVIHCPALAYCIYEYKGLIVWVIRPFEEVIASQKRIGWGDKRERANYNAIEDKQHICEIKYDRWVEQRLLCENWLEVEYHSLINHALFVKDRQEWGFRQWQP